MAEFGPCGRKKKDFGKSGVLISEQGYTNTAFGGFSQRRDFILLAGDRYGEYTYRKPKKTVTHSKPPDVSIYQL